MNKLIEKFIICSLVMLSFAAVSCSDDDKDYPEDVYFTGTLEPVQVVSASGTKAPGSNGSSAFNITFDASGDWSISAHDLFNPQETANWVKFFNTSGKEGSQLVGIYADANPSTKERAAIVEINCKGASVSFTLIQQATAPVTNHIITNPNKQVTKIIYSDSHSMNFTYSEGEILARIEDIQIFNGKEEKMTTTITSDAQTTSDGIAVNKVVIKSNHMPNATYGVVNGKIAVAYSGTDVALGNKCMPSYYGYNVSNYLTSVSGNGIDLMLTWDNGNLTSFKTDIKDTSAPVNCTQTAAYANEPNDANFDLVWFLNFTDPGINIIGPAMNLMGGRSVSLPSRIVNDKYGSDIEHFTYTAGVTDDKGNTLPGLTMTSTNDNVVKVYYAN